MNTNNFFYAIGGDNSTEQTILDAIENTLLRHDDFCCEDRATALRTAEAFFNVAMDDELIPGQNSEVRKSFTLYEVTVNVVPRWVITKTARQNVEVETSQIMITGQ